MRIIIKGMEMPKNLGVSVTIYPDGRVIRYLGYGAKEQLGTAVPVPPHGRLIDADALYGVVQKRTRNWAGGWNDIECVLTGKDIKNAPTIIPAEEGE